MECETGYDQAFPTTADQLPDDLAALKAMVLAREVENQRLRQIIKELQRHRFGRRAETLPEDQLLLGLEEAEQIESAGMKTRSAPLPRNKRREPQGAGRTGFSARPSAAHRDDRRYRGSCLPVLPEQPASDRRGCERTARHRAGAAAGDRDAPAQIRVPGLRGSGRAGAGAPPLIEGGLPTEATVAQVLVSKYADHLPLYRQAQIWSRQGIDLDRSTLADWVGRAAWHLRPVHRRLLEKLKASPKLFADETTAPVLDPGRGRTKTGQLWAYARDDRPWLGDPPGVAYVYAPDRKAERPIAHLAGFSGILQVDGYGGYRTLAEKNGVMLAFRWSHVRRRFYELAATWPAPIAGEALTRIESDIRGRSASERRVVRQEEARRSSSPRRSATPSRAGRDLHPQRRPGAKPSSPGSSPGCARHSA